MFYISRLQLSGGGARLTVRWPLHVVHMHGAFDFHWIVRSAMAVVHKQSTDPFLSTCQCYGGCIHNVQSWGLTVEECRRSRALRRSVRG